MTSISHQKHLTPAQAVDQLATISGFEGAAALGRLALAALAAGRKGPRAMDVKEAKKILSAIVVVAERRDEMGMSDVIRFLAQGGTGVVLNEGQVKQIEGLLTEQIRKGENLAEIEKACRNMGRGNPAADSATDPGPDGIAKCGDNLGLYLQQFIKNMFGKHQPEVAERRQIQRIFVDALGYGPTVLTK